MKVLSEPARNSGTRQEIEMTASPLTSVQPSLQNEGNGAFDTTTTCTSGEECGLCRKRGAEQRQGRLGRYAKTCDSCEAARGSHLAKAS